MKHLLIITLSLITNFANAQELVVNGSFENNSALPTGEAQWWHCNSWNNVNMQAIAHFSYATPDYYHEDATIGNYDLPTSARGTISPHTGKAIMGLLCFNQVGNAYLNFREYLSNQLVSPMVVGETYTVSFWMSNAEATTQRRYGSTSMGSLGIHFSTSPLSQPTRDIIAVTPQLVVAAAAPWSDTWTLQTFTYTATSAWEYITIGNFTPTALQARTVQDPTAQYSAGSYYFIDDVSILPASVLPVEIINFDAICHSNKVELNWATASEINNDYFTIERSEDCNKFEPIGRVDGNGNSTDILNYSWTDDNPKKGTSYYRLKQTDFDGKTQYHDVASVSCDKSNDISIYPNPFENNLTIQLLEEYRTPVLVEIHDYSGRVVSSDLIPPGTLIHHLNIETKLSKGFYFIQMHLDGEILLSKKIKKL